MPPPNTPIKSWPTPNVTDVLFYVERNSLLAQYQTFEYNTPYEDKEKYPHHKLVYVTPQTEERWSRWYYAADREHQDFYNFKFTSTDIGGHNFESVTRSYLLPRHGPNAYVAGQPAIGSNMPRTPEAVFGHYLEDDFIVANTKQDHAGMELDSLYVAVDVTYVNWCDNKSLLFDESSSHVLPDETKYYGANEVVPDSLNPDNKTAAELFAEPNNTFWGLRSDGTIVDGKQISCDWFTISWRKVVIGTGDAGSYGIPIRSYTTNETFLWPGIFNITRDMAIKPVTRFVDRTHTTTYDRYIVRITLTNPPYNGPTKFQVDEYWSKTPVTLPTIDKMIPKEITFQGANYNVQLAPTLHPETYFTDNIGTSDPEFHEGTYGQTFAATNFTEWPETLVVNANQTPFRGGYRILIQTAYRPDFYVP
jgi:hypothetical protein